MDISTFVGLLIAFGALIGGYVIDGGRVASLVLLSPFVIVFGGTLGAVVIS
ncbi:MAG TPA: motility protein A, partial [Ruminococcaceae bacterium]|nr:motility protein A [Oscillospiraceae bacterium]HCB91344.1 motility protein A [Oscillospiraceae bacterium]